MNLKLASDSLLSPYLDLRGRCDCPAQVTPLHRDCGARGKKTPRPGECHTHTSRRSPGHKHPQIIGTFAAATLLLISCVSSAFGQQAGRSQATQQTVFSGTSSAGAQLQPIIITATYRAGTVQNTPISITAISGAQLAAQGITSVEGAMQQVPGISMVSAGAGQTQYTIRGLTPEGGTMGTVGFYLDDVPIAAPSGAQNGFVEIDPDLYDLNRVEVLRGPQGTLYGAGSMGGTINLHTNQPQLTKFSGSAQVDGSSTDGGGLNNSENAMINLPIVNGKLAVRIVGTHQHTSGWINRIVLNNFPLETNPQPQCAGFYGCTRGNVLSAPVSQDYHDVNDENLTGGRIIVLYQPTEWLSLTASADTQHLSMGGLSYYDDPPGTEAHYQPFNVPEPFSDAYHLYSFVGRLSLPAFTLTSVTGYWNRTQSQVQDISETMQTAFGLPTFNVSSGGVGAESISEADGTRQFTQEVRLASSGNGKFQWLLGGFYSNYTYTQGQFGLGAGYIPIFGTDNLYSLNLDNGLTQSAAFGQISYDLTDRLKATAGLRWYTYSQNSSGTSSGIVASPTPKTTGERGSASGTNPSFTLSYDISHDTSHDIMVYGTGSKGFRPGSGEGPLPVSAADSCQSALAAIGLTSTPTQTKADTIWNYELGEKATLLDRRIIFNSDVYYDYWDDRPQAIELSCGFGFVANVGRVDIRGAEATLDVRLSPSWTLEQSGGYTDAFIAATGPDTETFIGEGLYGVPKYSLNTSLVYTHGIGNYTLVARAQNTKVASQEALSFFPEILRGYDIADARVGLVGDTWSGFLYVKNLTNVVAQLSLTHDYAEDIPSLNRVATNQPRTIGITLDYYFH